MPRFDDTDLVPLCQLRPAVSVSIVSPRSPITNNHTLIRKKFDHDHTVLGL